MLTLTQSTKPFLADSIAQILNEVVTVCVPNGFYHYLAMMSWENVAAFDRETINEIETVKWRYQGAGIAPADVRYLRFERWCIIMATGGRDAIFDAAQTRVGDIRETPLGFCGYVISCTKAHVKGGYEASVALDKGYLEMVRSRLVRLAACDPLSEAAQRLRSLDFPPYPDVRDQIAMILQAVNQERKAKGLELVSRSDAGLEDAVILSLPSGETQG